MTMADEVKDRSAWRVFGLTMAACFLALSLWPLVSGRNPHLWGLVLAAVLAALALLAPALLRHPHRYWLRLGDLLHRIVSPIMLAIVYFLVMTPISLLMRATGRSFLSAQRNGGHGKDTHWISREPPGPAPDSLKKQY
jgi:hypothetical protein